MADKQTRGAVRPGRRRLPGEPESAGWDGRVGPAGRPGCRLRHLRRLRRVELRHRRGRLGRPADRHHLDGDHVHVHRAGTGRALVHPAGGRRRLRLRPAGTRSAWRLRHRHGDPDRVRGGTSGHRDLHRRLRRGARAVRADELVAGLSGRLHDLRRHPPARGRRGAAGDVRHHRGCRRRTRHVHRRDDPQVRRRQPVRHRSDRCRRGQRLHPVRLRRGARCAGLRDLVLPGGRGRAAGRRGSA